MSLSNDEQKPRRGPRVIMGIGSHGPQESALSELTNPRENTAWTQATQDKYMERVRERATAAAQDIITKAMAEAEALKANAHAEGLQAASAEMQAQLNAALEQQSQTLTSALQALQQGTAAIWEEQRADIVALVHMTVEKILSVELEERRSTILASLLDQSLEAIDSQVGLTIRVNPTDEELIGFLLTQAQQHHPDLDRWNVRKDDKLSPGSIILESTQGMVDNSINSRKETVLQILEQLSSPASSENGEETP